MKRMQQVVLGLMLVLGASATWAAQGQWTEGFGHGVSEYFIDQGDLRLYIACPGDGNSENPSSVTLSSVKSGRNYAKFTVDVGGTTFEGPVITDSRAGDGNFTGLLERLRKGDAVVKVGGNTVTFPKANATKVLPVYGKKNWSCNLSF